MGLDWDEDAQQLIAWNNSSLTTQISVFTPPASNPATSAWTASVLSVDGSNAVTPTTGTSTGTHGRFAYSPTLKGCVLLNGTTQSLYFFATEGV